MGAGEGVPTACVMGILLSILSVLGVLLSLSHSMGGLRLSRQSSKESCPK